jgi:hypothetical protein
MVVLCVEYYSGNQIKDDDMGRTSNRHGIDEKCIQHFSKEKEH